MNTENQEKKRKSFIIPLLIALILLYFVVTNWDKMWNVILVLLGFGAVVFVHELGHFIAAKSVGIMVEAFSIGFGPSLIAFKRAPYVLQVNILPSLHLPPITLPWFGAAGGETEYRISLIPLGGFVKMLGQEDLAADKPSDNPRSFGNKPIWQRAIVISAGVFMNVICGAVVFMIVFAHGVYFPSAVVGFTLPGAPAALAGIRGGDEIIAIGDKKDINFMDLTLAAAFVGENQAVPLTVRHPDGSVQTYDVVPANPQTQAEKDRGIRILGIAPSSTLTIAHVKQPDVLTALAKLGFQPGDTIVAVNGRPITQYYQLHEVIYPPLGASSPPSVTLTIARAQSDEKTPPIDITIPMIMTLGGSNPGQLLGMVPRLKVGQVNLESAKEAGLEKGDIILQIGSLINPTFQELREFCANNDNQISNLIVARKVGDHLVEKQLQVTPQMPSISIWQQIFLKPDIKPVIGFITDLDTTHTVVADASSKNPSLPRGAEITAIADTAVSDWRDMYDILLRHKGQEVKITYRLDPSQPLQSTTAAVPDNNDWLGFVWQGDFDDLFDLPLMPLDKLYQGASWLANLEMGFDRTISFIAMTYLSIRGMIQGTVSINALSGPIGIMKMSYTVVEQRTPTYYFYFMALISVCVAVFNFLPLPILDGGLIVILLIEKIKGSPIPVRVQEIVTYIGLILIVGFALLVTYHDIIKIISGQL